MLHTMKTLWMNVVVPLGLSGRSPHWPKMRAAHLKLHNECAACSGRKNLEVHHIKPFHLHPELELSEENLLTLCEMPSRNCHLTWGHFYDWTKFNVNVINDTSWWRVNLRS